MVWQIWVYTTWAVNYLDPNRFPARTMLVVLMLGSLVLAAGIPYAFADRGTLIAITYVAMQAGRALFVIAALGFTGASALCATADSLGQMIVYRAMQGFCGGAITPTVWPVVYTKFRGRQLATVIAIISVILSLSSTLGPTLGGFLTDTFSWHWLFLVNIVPGLLVAAVVWVTIDIDKPDLSLLRKNGRCRLRRRRHPVPDRRRRLGLPDR